MSAKELAIAVAAAGLVGGAAGAAAAIFAAPKEDAAASRETAAMLDRMKATENELAKTKAALEASTRSMHELQERVAGAEIAAAKQAALVDRPRGFEVNGRPIRLGGRHATAGEASNGESAVEVVRSIDLGAEVGEQMGVELGRALEGIGTQLGDVGGQLEALRNGLDLRKLPDEKRWEKAKEDLGLTWNQVEDLKRAVADRDAAMKAANVVEKKEGPNGGRLTISRPDAGKMAHAQADYHDRVGAALGDEQKKKDWQTKGYDHAFGSGPMGMGGGMVMAIDVSAEAKDEKKDAK
jgi:hypothetical protein